ncbi:MAG: PIN domain-containing protein [Actinobacteria bacterium]|nr:PIN domain-containing protein [Actinomycetota bacterium]
MSVPSVLDAGFVIGLLDANDAHHRSAVSSLRRLLKSRARLLISAATYAEALVGPMRRGPMFVRRMESQIGEVPDLEIVAVDLDVARRAAYRRANDVALKLPDAIVLATADLAGAEMVLTTDKRLARHDRVITVAEFSRR